MTGATDKGPAGVETHLWPLERRDDLLAALAAAAGLEGGFRMERFELSYRDVAAGLGAVARGQAPALLRAGQGGGGLLAIAAVRGDQVVLLRPEGGTHGQVVCEAEAVAAFLRAPAEVEVRAASEATVARAGFGGRRAGPVVEALLAATLGAERVAEGTRLRRSAPSLRAALRAAGVLKHMAVAVAGYVAQLALLAALWALVGREATARAGTGWLPTAGLLIAALVGTRLLASWLVGRLAIDVGGTLRDRLLHGLLRLDSESTRSDGIGRLLGRVVESEALEALALGGGLVAAAGLFELAAGAVVILLGSAGGTHLAVLTALAAWLFVGAWLARRAFRLLARWTGQRIALTHDLVERMVGQRTLVAQQPPELRHLDEDAALGAYAEIGRRMDRAVADLSTVVPRGWLVSAVVLLAPAFREVSRRPGATAASLAGVLLVYVALRKLAQAFPALAGALLAWRNVEILFAGAGDPGWDAPSGDAAVSADVRSDDVPLIAARDLSFRYPGRAEPVIRACAFEIRRGDKLLLEGPSGGGKSTLGALVTGLRVPDSGTLHLAGEEQRALGLARWRARVGAAPQFHENHVFSASFLFNLLLGRAWPPRREDVLLAQEILEELDLGPLLARMPSGLEQLVGESGWQLSHGEKSRLFIARSLLQPLEARVLDESFAALDPETLEKALACVMKRAPTLIVIAHP